MAHVRQTIRDHIVSAVTGLSTTGANVFPSRVYPIAAGKMPGLAVYTLSEAIEAQTLRPPRGLVRILEISIEAYVEGSTNDDVLDNICAEVEAAVAADITRGGNAKDTILVSFEADYADGERPLVVGRLTYQVTYSTAETNATSAT